MVVVSNQAAFEFRYGTGAAVIAGQYSGQFSNGGEIVRLEAADTSVIVEFAYGEGTPWPERADGDGYSLVFTGADPTEAHQHRIWRQPGGD